MNVRSNTRKSVLIWGLEGVPRAAVIIVHVLPCELEILLYR